MSIKFTFKLDPAASQVDAAIVYFAKRTGQNVRDYVRMAVEERTAQLAELLKAQLQEQQAEQGETLDDSNTSDDVSASGTQSIQSSEPEA